MGLGQTKLHWPRHLSWLWDYSSAIAQYFSLGLHGHVSTAFTLKLLCLPADVLCACGSLGGSDSRSLGVTFCLLAVPVLCDQKLF